MDLVALADLAHAVGSVVVEFSERVVDGGDCVVIIPSD